MENNADTEEITVIFVKPMKETERPMESKTIVLRGTRKMILEITLPLLREHLEYHGEIRFGVL